MTIFGSNRDAGVVARVLQLGADPVLAGCAKLLFERLGLEPVAPLPSEDATRVVSAAMMLWRPIRRQGHFDTAERVRELIDAFHLGHAQWVHAWFNVFPGRGQLPKTFDEMVAICVESEMESCLR